MREASYFTRHHRKAAALFAGAGSFHRSVQREDIGLKGDTVDHADDVGNTLARSGDVIHRADHLANGCATGSGRFARVAGQLGRPSRRISIVLDRGVHLLH